MGQGHRLRLLQMGKARHICVKILLHNLEYLFHKRHHQRINLIDLIAAVQLHIQSHLIIAASSRVKAFARVADALSEFCLHEGVDILVLIGEHKTS